jgi:ABC-2 type transport system permease protein
MSIVSLIIKESLLPRCGINLYCHDFLSPLLGNYVICMYLSSMKADTKRIAIHDESGIVVKEFTSQNNKMRNTNTLI